MGFEEDTPEIGETVICRVTKVLGYGVFVELVEYGDRKGFVHISEVASRWVKNIRNHVRDGQIRAAKVLSLNPSKGQIDLSLAKVSSQAQRAKIEEWKQLKRSKKLIELLAKSEKAGFEEAWEATAKPLLSEYDTLYEGFQQIALKGTEAAKMVPSKWRKPLVELIKKSISPPEKTVKGKIELHSLKPNGAEVIRNALDRGLKAVKDAKAEVFYVKGGKYALRATSSDFKSAEKKLEQVAEAIAKEIEKEGGKANFVLEGKK